MRLHHRTGNIHLRWKAWNDLRGYRRGSRGNCSLAKSHGVEYVFAAVFLAGVIEILAGIFRLGKFIRLVPHPVVFGFVNGLAIVIFLSQLD